MHILRLLDTPWSGLTRPGTKPLAYLHYVTLVFLLAFLSITVSASAVMAPMVECGGAVWNGCFQAATNCTSDIEGWGTSGNLSSFIVDNTVLRSDIAQEPLAWSYICSGDLFARVGVPVPPVWQPRSWAALYQDITVPGGAGSRPELRFTYRIVTHDIKAWSAFRVQLRRPDDSGEVLTGGQILEDGYVPPSGTFGEKNNDLGWKSAIVDLSAFRGQTVRLWFQNEHKWDKAVGIWTYLDDVSVFDNRYQIYMPIVARNSAIRASFASPSPGVEPPSPDGASPWGHPIPRPPTPTPVGR